MAVIGRMSMLDSRHDVNADTLSSPGVDLVVTRLIVFATIAYHQEKK
jgi:hypothetical protein